MITKKTDLQKTQKLRRRVAACKKNCIVFFFSSPLLPPNPHSPQYIF